MRLELFASALVAAFCVSPSVSQPSPAVTQSWVIEEPAESRSEDTTSTVAESITREATFDVEPVDSAEADWPASSEENVSRNGNDDTLSSVLADRAGFPPMTSVAEEAGKEECGRTPSADPLQ